jgi:hypothetical protein
MIAVCNTSPISNLIQVQQLRLLLEPFSEVFIPPEVAGELDDGKEIIGAWQTAPGAEGLSIRPARDHALVEQLAGYLHVGEAAAITLAAEIPGAILVNDESDGRRAAMRLKLHVTGTLGLFIVAKRRGRIAAIAPLIEELQAKAHFWVAPDVVRRALQLAGE